VAALFFVAVALGLDNFGAATAIGLAGPERHVRWRVALVFGVFEGLMPLLGLALGRSLAKELGHHASLVAGLLLALTGVYIVVSEIVRGDKTPPSAALSTRRLVVLGAALGLDNLVVGFALGAYRVNVLVAVLVIAVVSVGLTLLGLELGARVGPRLGGAGEVVGGAVLVVVGLLVATGVL